MTTHNEVRRRDFLRMVGGLGGGMFLLSACGGPSASSGPISLNFWTPGGSQAFCTMQKTIGQNYVKSHKNISTIPVTCGTGQQDFNEVLLARIAAGNPPDATILWSTPVSMGVRGALEPLDALMQSSQHSQAEKWPSGVLASCQFKGKTYGLPVTAGTYGLWYNQELFEKKGISTKREDFPKTWDELRRISKEFTFWKGDRLETAGFLPIRPGDTVVLPIWSVLNGSQIYDAENQKYTIDSDQNIAMMDFFLSWLNDEYKGDLDKVTRSGAWGGYPDDQGQPPTFQTGRQAMLLEGCWLMGDFYASVTPNFQRWNVANIPVGPGGSKTASGYYPNWVVIPQGSKHKEEAFKYLDDMSVNGIKTWFNVNPDLPANKEVSHDLVPSIVVQKRGKEFALDVTRFFFQQQDISIPMWNSPVEDFASDQLTRTLERIMKKAAKPAQALKDAQKACQDKLDATLKGK